MAAENSLPSRPPAAGLAGRAQQPSLAAVTIQAVAGRGLESVSLRTIATDAGTSTAAIFQMYAGKAELLEDALDLAIRRERDFHAELLAQTAGVEFDWLGLASLIDVYVGLHAARDEARLMLEVLINAIDQPQCRARLQDWSADKAAFWRAVTGPLRGPPELADVIATYALMEEIYTQSLGGDAQYRLLRSETCRAVCDAAAGGDWSRDRPPGVGRALAVDPLPVTGERESPGNAVAERLLDAAVDIVTRSGVPALNQRAVTKMIGVSSSAIAYHFTDMKQFTMHALWRALTRQLPAQFRPDSGANEVPETWEDWLAMLENFLDEQGARLDSGFYLGFSRLSAEASLIARRNAVLLPLMSYLRKLEGWGTYHVTRQIEPLAGTVRQDHAAVFGLWVKGEALLRMAGVIDPQGGERRIEAAMRTIFPGQARSARGR